MARTIVLISCVSKKLNLQPGEKICAKDLYVSPLFKKAWQYARQIIKPDKIYILSAQHHLLTPDTPIGTYNKTLNKMNTKERRQWAKVVLEQMRSEGLDLENDQFYLLAGHKYYKDLLGEDGIRNPAFDPCLWRLSGYRAHPTLPQLTNSALNERNRICTGSAHYAQIPYMQDQ